MFGLKPRAAEEEGVALATKTRNNLGKPVLKCSPHTTLWLCLSSFVIFGNGLHETCSFESTFAPLNNEIALESYVQ